MKPLIRTHGRVLEPDTVDHHVAAVLQKLGVPTRREAARAAFELSLAGRCPRS